VRTALAALVLIAVAGRSARADDPKRTSVTVLPWSGAIVTVSEDDKTFTGAFNAFLGRSGARISVDASAPFDSDDETAALVSESELASGVAATATLTYDSTYAALGRDATFAAGRQLELCARLEVDPCLESEVRHKLAVAGAQNAIPTGDGSYWAIGGSLGGRFDRISAYVGDVAAAPRELQRYSIEAGGYGALYWAGPGVALTGRAGLSVDRSVRTATFERCVTLPSSDESTVGRSCRNALLAAGSGDASVAGYARGAVTYIGSRVGAIAGYVPGGELRFNGEQIGQDAALTTRVSLFIVPREGVALRTGFAAEVTTALTADEAAGVDAGDTGALQVVGFVGIGFGVGAL
jgi:hypothetical protein